uniref:Uncharacterized protein n=1 Tax=Knipowitschia caucasica TaxID=637954 RepID=A0AAV2MMM3_KNICA
MPSPIPPPHRSLLGSMPSPILPPHRSLPGSRPSPILPPHRSLPGSKPVQVCLFTAPKWAGGGRGLHVGGGGGCRAGVIGAVEANGPRGGIQGTSGRDRPAGLSTEHRLCASDGSSTGSRIREKTGTAREAALPLPSPNTPPTLPLPSPHTPPTGSAAPPVALL